MDAQCQETQCTQWHEREKGSCCPSHCTTSRHPQPGGMWPLHLLPCPQHPGACMSLPGREACPLGLHPCASWWRKRKDGLNIWAGGPSYAHGMHKPAGWPQENVPRLGGGVSCFPTCSQHLQSLLFCQRLLGFEEEKGIFWDNWLLGYIYCGSKFSPGECYLYVPLRESQFCLRAPLAPHQCSSTRPLDEQLQLCLSIVFPSTGLESFQALPCLAQRLTRFMRSLNWS